MTETKLEVEIEKTKNKTNIVMDSQVLTTLMSCACLTDYRFNHNLQSLSGKSNSIECGSILHKYMEVYYGSIIKGLSRQDAHGFGLTSAQLYISGCPDCTDFIPTIITREDGLKETYSKPKCNHRTNDYPGLINTPAESEGYKTGWKFVLETCEQYYNHYKNDHWIPLEVEVVKSKVIYEDDEIRILWKAKLDLLSDTNQGIYPIDHKTMKQNREIINLNNQFTGQCVVTDSRSVIINEIGFQKTLKPIDRFHRKVIGYTPERLLEWSTEIVPYWAKMLLMYNEMGHWPRNYTACEGKYGRCAFTGVCIANPNMREEELKLNFKVGPVWNPTNLDETE